MILPDLGLLRRRRDLRLLVGGSTVSLIGAAFTQVALTVQVFDLTDSSIAVGLLGVAQFIPIIALALIGGALADAFDRRKLIFGAELASAFVSAALLVNALLPSPQLWLLYVASTLFAAATAVLRPPLDALLPRLVERDELKAASAISWSLMSISGIVGPALAGLVIAGGGVEAAYAIDVVSFVGSLSAFALMRTPPPPPDAEPPSLRGVIEGVKYAGSRQEILGSYVIDMHAMFFGMPFALFPAVAERYGGTEVVGLLWGGTRGRRDRRDADERLERPRTPQRPRDRVRRRGLGRVRRAVRVRRRALAGVARARARGGRRRHQRHLPRRALERDDPGPAARAAGGDGDDLVVLGAAARQRARGPRRVVARARALDRRGWCDRRSGVLRVGRRSAALLELRLAGP